MKEIQSAFGSQVGGSLDASAQVSAVTVDAGGQSQKTKFNAEGEKKVLEGITTSIQK